MIDVLCERCGISFSARADKVSKGLSRTCSRQCLRAPFNLAGQTFGRLFVVCKEGPTTQCQFWRCRCICGRIAMVRARSLRAGKTTSCGCFGKERRLASVLKHGDSGKGKPFRYLYGSWSGHKHHIAAGNRGEECNRSYAGMPFDIRWEDYNIFKADVLTDIGERPTAQHTLDIIIHARGFVRGNVRWANKNEQTANRRHFLTATAAQILARVTDEEFAVEALRRGYRR